MNLILSTLAGPPFTLEQLFLPESVFCNLAIVRADFDTDVFSTKLLGSFTGRARTGEGIKNKITR